MIDKIRNTISDKIAVRKDKDKSIEEVTEEILDMLEDSDANQQAMEYARLIPITSKLYNDDIAIKNNIEFVMNNISDKKTKEKLKEVMDRYTKKKKDNRKLSKYI